MRRSPISAVLRERRHDVPFAEFALTLLLFTHRLHSELRRSGATHAMFLAREGRFLMDLFEIYQSEVATGRTRIATDYAYVSRRALYAASVAPGTYDLAGLRGRYPDLGVNDVLESLGLDIVERDLLAGMAHDVDHLLELDAFRVAFETHRSEQHDLALAYLQPFLDRASGALHVVDVGWKGSMQDFLGDLIGDEHTLHGWYLGLGPGVQRERVDGSTKRGLLFEAGPPPSRYFQVFAHYKSLYETLLNADHGSVVSYTASSSRVQPVLDPRSEEVSQHLSVINPIQGALRELFTSLLQIVTERELDSSTFHDTVAKAHARMMFRPTTSEVRLVESLHHFSNFGPMAMQARATTMIARSEQRLRSSNTNRRRSSAQRAPWPPLDLYQRRLFFVSPFVGRLRAQRALRG